MRYRDCEYLALFIAVLCCYACAMTRSVLAHASPVPVIYVSDADTSAIGVFRTDTGRQVGSIAYPMAPGGLRFATGAGLGTDAANNLFASFTFDDGHNYPGKIVIFGFAPGKTHWFTTIAGGCCGSPNLAVSSRGEIAEALGFFPPDYAGGVGFVEPGKRFVGRYNLTLIGTVFAAYDARETLWVGGVDAGFRPHFGFIGRGSPAFEAVTLQPAPHLGPMAVDRASNVLVDNDRTLYAYDRRGAFAYLVRLNDATGVVGIALTHDGSKLYVAKKSGTVLAYDFPRGGNPIAVYNVGGKPNAITLGAI